MVRLAALLWLAIAGWMPADAYAVPTPAANCTQDHKLEATHDDTPSWETLGLEDLLTPPNQCSVTAPQSAQAHNGGSAHHGAVDPAAARPLPATRQLHHGVPIPTRPNDYYLYFLYRLRL